LACTGVGACGPSGGGTTYTIVFSLGDNAPDVDSVHFTATYEGGNILGSGATSTAPRWTGQSFSTYRLAPRTLPFPRATKS
jgi:hypothetical protein